MPLVGRPSRVDRGKPTDSAWPAAVAVALQSRHKQAGGSDRSTGRHHLKCNGWITVLPAVLLESRRTQLNRRKDWTAIIHRLNQSRRGELRIRMGSPGSAQVTRCRLLAEWSNLEVSTAGSVLRLRLASR